MPDSRHLTWAQLQSICEDAAPRTFPLSGEPQLYLRVEHDLSGLTLLIPWDTTSPPPKSRLTQIDVREVEMEGRRMLAIGSSERDLLRECHSFLLTVADFIQLRKMRVGDAISQALDTWRNLLGEMSVLSLEAQIGLLGELWVVQRLWKSKGPAVLSAWLGPTGEPHDLRFPGVDFEVKATRNVERRHIISGLGQLSASPRQRLYLVSIQLEPVGASDGTTLPRAVERLQSSLAGFPSSISLLGERLNAVGYKKEHSDLYLAGFRLRSQPAIVEVTDSLPVISRQLLEARFGVNAARIGEVTYELDVGGLGWLEESVQFQQLLPRPSEGDLF